MIIDFMFSLLFAAMIAWVIGGFAGIVVAAVFAVFMGIVCTKCREIDLKRSKEHDND
jgi:uncharacterized membrane protein